MNKELIGKYWNIFLVVGALALIAALLILRASEDDSPLLWVGAALSVVSGLGMAIGIYGAMQKHPADERFVLHRLKATRFALVLGLIALGVFMIIDGVTKNEIRYDLMIIAGTIAAGKLGGMAYFKLRQ